MANAAGQVARAWFNEADGRPAPGYDPAIALYRVYRVAPDQSATLIGETPTTSFTDTAAPRGTTQRYVVTAVQRSGQESGRSDIVELRIP